MKPRIVIIENNLLSPLTMREKLTAELMRLYDVTILSTGNEAQKTLAAEKGFNVIEIGACDHNIIRVLKYMIRLWSVMRRIKPDLCLTFTIRPAIWGNLITRLLGIPTITTITGTGPLFSTDNIVYRAARKLYKVALRRTRRVFFQNSDDMRLFIENKFVRAGVCAVIPGSGVDSSHFSPVPQPANGTFKFLFIGRLVKDKGILEFVEAASILRKKDFPVECHVLGPFWSQNLKENTVTREEMNQWIEIGSIKYLGEAEDVRPFMASSNCVVLPSYREGLNNVLLEASSMERPCITTDTTGCREIVEDGINGFLCEVRNAESLAEKMEKMFSIPDELRIEMGRSARRKVIKEFDKKIVIGAYMKEITAQFTHPHGSL